MPIMTTGGIVRLPVAQQVLDEGVDMVGIGRALAFSPALPNEWLISPSTKAVLPDIQWKDKTMAALSPRCLLPNVSYSVWVKVKRPKLNSSPLISLIADKIRLKKLTKIYRKRYVNA